MKAFKITFFAICILLNLELFGKAQSVSCDKGWAKSSVSSSPYSSAAEQFIRAVKKGSIEIPYYVRNYADNPDYIEILVNGEQIPRGVPSVEIYVRVEFYKLSDKSKKVNESYPLKLCPGRWSNKFPPKPKGFEGTWMSGFNILRPVLKVGENSFIYSDGETTTDTSLLAAETDYGKFENYRLLEESEFLIFKIKKSMPKIENYDDLTPETEGRISQNVVLSPDCQINNLLSVSELIESSDSIVLAKAVNYLSSSGKTVDGVEIKLIKFNVEKVLKGNKLESINLNGFLSEKEYKGSEIIEDVKISREGKKVNCVAIEYQQNKKYLIFLKKIEGKLKLYHYPVAPVNEQIFENDTWLKYIENKLSSKK